MNKILVIEDESDIATIVHRVLTANGFEVFKARSGEEGLVKATSVDPDLIILDLMMPGLSGLEVCRLLKKREDTESIPIIILSALSREVDKKYAREVGADLYISKPFVVEDLLLAVDKLMN